MKHWAQFYRRRDGAFTEAPGGTQIFWLDNRLSLASMNAKAEEVCRQRGFSGWRIARGHTSRPFFLSASVKEPRQ